MDTAKLLKVINDILEKDAQAFLGLLDTLLSQVAENTPESVGLAEENRQKISELFESSLINQYSPSYATILTELGADKYIGRSAHVALDKVFNQGPLNLQARLTAYVEEYRAFVDRITRLRTSLVEMGFEPYETKEFEIGFLLPTELDNMQVVAKKLGLWDRFIVISSQIAGDEQPVAKLTRLNNGSLEFYVAQGIVGAKIIDTVLNHVLSLIQEFQNIQKARVVIEGLKLDNKRKQTLLDELTQGEQAQEELCIQDATKEVFQEHYNNTKDRQPELETQFAVALKILVVDIQEGVKLEVSAPTAGTTDAPSEDSQIEAGKIAELNKELKLLYSKPLEIKRLPFTVPTAEEVKVLEEGLPAKKPVAKKPQTPKAKPEPSK